jgi:hypothetical protein
VDLASLIFITGAPSYSIATDRKRTLTFWDQGVRNDSGVEQTFTGGFSFNGDSSAGDNVTYVRGNLSFHGNATAGSASFNDTVMDFFDNASAGDGVLPTQLSFSIIIPQQEMGSLLWEGMEVGK